MTAQSGHCAGGILGHARQYCEINDCVNIGPHTGVQTNAAGGVAGWAGGGSSINNCLNVGTNWYAAISNYGNFVSLENSYYYGSEDHSGKSAAIKISSLDGLCNTSSFRNWDFTGTYARWDLVNEKGYFPIPNHSEMEEAIK